MNSKLLKFTTAKFIVLMTIAGMLIGGTTAYYFLEDERECRALEDDLREGQTFDGTVSCYPPGTLEANIAEELEDRTSLKCVCRIIQNDDENIYPIVTG